MSGTAGAAPLRPTGESSHLSAIPSPGMALWNQRETIADLRGRFEKLSLAVGCPQDLVLYQWAEIAAFALEFRPDLIVELGRGWGNSTCCFIEVANRLGGVSACRVVSLCRNDEWFTSTAPRLKHTVPPEWFAPAEIRVCDILECDPAALLGGAQRCLIFWDAHGFEVAEWVLGKLLPRLVDKAHLVVMHDLEDIRYDLVSPDYGEKSIWKGVNADRPSFWLGHISSNVAQAISIVDFTSRNRLPLHSAADSLHDEIAGDPTRVASLREMLGDRLFSLRAHWSWFTLNEASTTLYFPQSMDKIQDDLCNETTALKQSMDKIQDDLRNETTALKQSMEKIQEDNALLLSSIKTQEENSRRLAMQKRELENLWVEIQNSAGWRMLNRWRELRNRVAAEGTLLRKLYDSVLRPVRGDSSRNRN